MRGLRISKEMIVEDNERLLYSRNISEQRLKKKMGHEKRRQRWPHERVAMDKIRKLGDE